jgi:nucleoside-diphosphate-sugar epimerase
MAQDQLKELFREKKRKAKPATINWRAKRDAWIKAVQSLYRTIEGDYLKSAKSDVDITHPDKVVTENYIGEYHIPELCLRVGDEQVIFSPKGVNVVGPAKGRIDVQGDRGEATIIWLPGNRWSIVASIL